MILALLVMSVVLYILVRRSIARRQAKRLSFDAKELSTPSGSSVAASDSPEVPRRRRLCTDLIRMNWNGWSRRFGA